MDVVSQPQFVDPIYEDTLSEELPSSVPPAWCVVPVDENAEPTSIGSSAHLVQACTPCVYFVGRVCRKGIFCDYCHFPHKTTKWKQLQKHLRLRIKQRIDEMEASKTTSNSGSACRLGVERGSARSIISQWGLQNGDMLYVWPEVIHL
mmetsp:Transcript_22477/g.64635  ORF Transcript_22477/g.64635 Transcript_22477/m.64635 type:complete len:148 (-) Transcript_22477:122-565(-)